MLLRELTNFLERLGLSVEPQGRNRLVARRRTALREETSRFVVAEDKAPKPARGSILIVPSSSGPPPERQRGEWYRFDDFLDHTVQADRIAAETASLEADPQIRERLSVFVPQRIAQAGIAAGADSVGYFFDEWLPNPESRLLVVLGPAGYGKTFLSYHLAQRLASAHMSSRQRPRHPIPFLVPFGKFRRVAEFEGMILTSLQRRGITDFTAGAFAYLVQRNRIVLFLDGFDELLEERPSEAQKNLRELIETLQGLGKVVITARSTFFRTSLDVSDFLEHFLQPEDVSVIDLLPFDATQRAQVIAQLSPNQTAINRVARIVESDGIREAMGSPLLLRETVEALLSGGAEIQARPSRADLFGALERSVYRRERARHAHDFSDQVQQAMLKDLAGEMLKANVRGFEMDLVRAVALEAAGQVDLSEGEIDKLADHHFLTVDPQSDEVRFNHQVFREYFQAFALLDALARDDLEWVVRVLDRRPLPEEVALFFSEVADPSVIDQLLRCLTKSEFMSDYLVSNIGLLCASFRDAAAVARLLSTVPPERPLSLKLAHLNLGGFDFRRRMLVDTDFVRCDLREADFSSAILQQVSFHECELDGARFVDTEAYSVVIDYDRRLFGTLLILEELARRGAELGEVPPEKAESLEEAWRKHVLDVVGGRLRRFYVPGREGRPEGSRWDTSIQEKNLLGGLSQVDRSLAASDIVPEMVRIGILDRDREHGIVIYRLRDRAKDDARTFIENGAVVGLIGDLIERLTRARSKPLSR